MTLHPWPSSPLAALSSVPRIRPLWWLLGAVVLTAVGCTSTRLDAPAPVEDRATPRPVAQPTPPAGTASATQPVAVLPTDPNAGKPGYYTVRPGDTLIRIGLETGQNWRDIARWNQIDNPNRIEVGQTLRVIPPVPGTSSAPATVAGAPGVATSPVGGAAVTAQPLPSPGAAPAAPPANPSGPTATAASPAAPAASAGKPAAASDEMAFAWPANGSVIAQFDGVKNKGIAIAGKAGDPVWAAADGVVIHVGAGLRGYGNMIILQHGNSYITAYAHNQTLLVKEDQKVKQGQKIAEMGSSDADRVKLHFEIRKRTEGGRPLDPLKLLPRR